MKDEDVFRLHNSSLILAVLAVVAVLAGVFPIGCRGGAGRHERQLEWVTAHPRAPSAVKRAVLNKELVQGMSEGAAVASWGEPRRRLDLGAGDSRWTYRRPQTVNDRRIVIEYTLIFNRRVLVRILTERAR